MAALLALSASQIRVQNRFPACRTRGGSEQELERELNLPRGGGRRGDHSLWGADAACGASEPIRARRAIVASEHNRIGVREIGLIENVEELGPKLQGPLLADLELLEKWGVHVDQPRASECSARNIAERPGKRDQERVGVEPLIGFSQYYRPAKVRIPIGDVDGIGVARARNIGANQRCEWEAALSRNDPVPLPSADQLIRHSSGAACEALPAPKRQLIAEVAIELVVEAVGGGPSVQREIIGAEDVRGFVFAARSEDGRIQIQNLGISVIRFKAKSASGALLKRDVKGMVAGGTHIKPGDAIGHKRVRAQTGGHVGRALRHNLP